MIWFKPLIFSCFVVSLSLIISLTACKYVLSFLLFLNFQSWSLMVYLTLILGVNLVILVFLIVKVYKFSELKSDLRVIYRSADKIHEIVTYDVITDRDKIVIDYESNFIIKYLSIFESSDRVNDRTKLLLEHENRMEDFKK